MNTARRNRIGEDAVGSQFNGQGLGKLIMAPLAAVYDPRRPSVAMAWVEEMLMIRPQHCLAIWGATSLQPQ